MAYIILNEWLLHDLRGDNGVVLQEQSYEFLRKVTERCDTLGLARPSVWMDKAYELMEHRNRDVRILSKYLHLGFILNESKCRILEEHELSPLPENLETVVPSEDRYLARIYLTLNASVIVTTDGRLVAVNELSGGRITTRMRDDFLAEYLTQ